MKLHLPKQLFTALLAAITLAAAPAAWGGWGADTGNNTDTYYMEGVTINALSTADEGADQNATKFFLRATQENTAGAITVLTLQNGETLTIAGDWNNSGANFESLTIDTLTINPATGASGNGAANLVIGAGQTSSSVYPTQNVTLNAINGTLSALSIDKNATLTLSKSIVTAGNKITALDLKQGGTLDLSGVTGVGVGKEAANFTNLMNSISGGGTVKLAQGLTLQTADQNYNGDNHVTLSVHYTVAGSDVADYSSTEANSDSADLTLQSWAKTNKDWRNWNVVRGGSLTVGDYGKGVLNVLSGNRLNITGGAVTAGIIRIGHSGAASNVGSIALTDNGQLTVGNILVQGALTDNWDNRVDLLDGTVEFTSAHAITYASNISVDVVLGGSGEEMLELVANTDWGISKHTHNNSSFTIGNITVNAGNTGEITLTNATATGNITNNATLNLASITVAAGTAATIGGTGTTTFTGTNTIAEGATLALKGSVAGLNTLTGLGDLEIGYGAGTISDTSLSTDFDGTLRLITGGSATIGANVVNGLNAPLEIDGGVLSINRPSNSQLQKSITVSNNGTLKVLASDLVNDTGTAVVDIELTNSTMQMVSSRYTMGATHTIHLNNSRIEGVNGSGNADYDGDGHGIIDISRATTITSAGTSSIDGAIRLRTTLTLALTGELTVRNFGGAGSLIVDGDGTLKMTDMGSFGSYQYYTGNTELKNNATLEYAMGEGTSGSYSGTIFGVGNISKSGAGSVTLTKVGSLDGKISVNAGSLTINELTNIKQTVEVKEGAQFSVGTVTVSKVGHQLDAYGEGNESYFIDGEVRGDNGYLAEDASYILFKGYEWDGTSVEGFTEVSKENGNTIVTNTGTSTDYYVNKGTVDYDTSSTSSTITSADTTGIILRGGTLNMVSALATTAENGIVILDNTSSSIKLNSGVTLDVASVSGVTTGELLSGIVTGEGRVKVTDTQTLTDGTTTTFGGILEIAGNGTDKAVELYVGTGTSQSVNLSSISNIVLNNGAQLYLHADPKLAQDFKKISVETGKGFLYLRDSDGAPLYVGEMAVASGANLTIWSHWFDSAVTVNSLTGSGTFQVESADNTAQNASVTVNSLVDFTGDINIIQDTGTNLKVELSTGTVEEGKSVSINSITVNDTHDGGKTDFDLNVQADTTIGTISVSGNGTNTINIAKEATLHSFTKTGNGTITLTGSGIFDLTGTAMPVDASGSGWTGTVKFTGGAIGTDIAKIGNANSVVELKGARGYVHNATLTTDLRLTNLTKDSVIGENHITNANLALQLDNGASNGAHNSTFAGKISGTGSMAYVWTSGTTSVNANINIESTTSDWDGWFITSDSAGKTVNVTFKSGGQVFDEAGNGGVIDWHETSQTNVIIDSTAKESTKTEFYGTISNVDDLSVVTDAEFKNTVDVNSVTVTSGKTASFGSQLDASTVNLGTATLTGKDGGKADMSNVQMSSAGVSAASTANGAKGSITDADVQIAQLAQDASFTIQDMTLTNTSITAASAKVDLKNIKASNVTLAEGAFTLAASPTLNVGAGGDESGTLTYSTSMGLGSREASLTLNLDVVNAVAGDQHGTYTLVIELTNFNSDAFEGVTGDAWGGYVGFQKGSWLADALNAPAALTGGSTSAPSVSYGFSAGSGSSNVGTLVITINGLNVPEPTTSTLSLLALAGLCARRRRKM